MGTLEVWELGNVVLLLWACSRSVRMCLECRFCVLVDPGLVVHENVLFVLCIVCVVLHICMLCCVCVIC